MSEPENKKTRKADANVAEDNVQDKISEVVRKKLEKQAHCSRVSLDEKAKLEFALMSAACQVLRRNSEVTVPELVRAIASIERLSSDRLLLARRRNMDDDKHIDLPDAQWMVSATLNTYMSRALEMALDAIDAMRKPGDQQGIYLNTTANWTGLHGYICNSRINYSRDVGILKDVKSVIAESIYAVGTSEMWAREGLLLLESICK